MNKEPPITIGHYGIIVDKRGVKWLEQERSGTNAIGLAEKSPFLVRPKKRTLQCPHMITIVNQMPDSAHLTVYEKVKQDNLVQIMEPWPKHVGASGIYYVKEDSQKIILHLMLFSRLTSPVRSIVKHIAQVDAQTIMDELSITNIQPLVIIGLEAQHTQLIETLSQVSLTATRKLLLVGASDVPLPACVTRLETDILKFNLADLMHINWESIGAALCRRVMRDESRDIDMAEWAQRREQRKQFKAAAKQTK